MAESADKIANATQNAGLLVIPLIGAVSLEDVHASSLRIAGPQPGLKPAARCPGTRREFAASRASPGSARATYFHDSTRSEIGKRFRRQPQPLRKHRRGMLAEQRRRLSIRDRVRREVQ